ALVASVPASRPAQAYREPRSESGALIKIIALFLGIAVAVLIFVAVWMGASAQNARDDARVAAAQTANPSMASMPGMGTSTAAASGLQSFAGTAPETADQIAAAHVPYPAALHAA